MANNDFPGKIKEDYGKTHIHLFLQDKDSNNEASKNGHMHIVID